MAVLPERHHGLGGPPPVWHAVAIQGASLSGLNLGQCVLLLLLLVSLPVQARITSCDSRAALLHTVDIPGTPPISASLAGDVLHRRFYRFSIGYKVEGTINNDRMRLGAHWTIATESQFGTVGSGIPGVGVRWRHMDNDSLGRIIREGESRWSVPDDYPKAAGNYQKEMSLVQEFVLTDPKLYQGGGTILTSAGFTIHAHGTGTGNSQNVSRGCNASGGAPSGNREDAKTVYTFSPTDAWGGSGGPPSLPAPSCKVSLASQKLSISLNSINAFRLNRKDEVSQDSVPFSIRLEECAINARPSINFTDAGTPSNTSHTLLANHASGSAKGLGVRLRRNGQTDLYFGLPDSSDSRRRIPLGTASSDTSVLTLELNAHYVRTTDEAIKPGSFSATTTFVLSYP